MKLYISTCTCQIFWIFLDVFLLFFTINLSFCFITTSLLFQTNLSPSICSWCFLDTDPKVWLGTMFFNQKLRKFLKMFIQYDEWITRTCLFFALSFFRSDCKTHISIVSYIWRFGHMQTFCKNTHGGMLLLVKLQAFSQQTLLQVTLLHACFSRFLKCTNGTKSSNTSYIWNVDWRN